MGKKTGIITAGVLLMLIIAGGMYAGVGRYYQDHFFEASVINGIDVSGLTAEEAEELIARQAEDYTLTVVTKEGSREEIPGDEIGYRFVSGGEIQGFLDSQQFLLWLPNYFGDPDVYSMQASVTYDQNLLLQAAAGLSCMQSANVTEPVDAHLEWQDGKYVIVPEVEGNRLDTEKVEQLLVSAVESGVKEVDFAEEKCYLEPQVRADDGNLKAEAAVRNKYTSITITYNMGGGVTETLGPETIAQWFSLDEAKQPVIDRDAVSQWVNQLADRYDTIGTMQEFTTSNGQTVSVEARTYGWQMDRESETEALYQQLVLGESAERSPVWLEGAFSRGQNDLGNTYVEIDYTNQRLWFYKDGTLIVETPVVTGNVSAGNASPEGIFNLIGKSEHETLKGEGYSTPVDYWMPFFGGVGIHDADSWRTVYGGDIYLTSGSHGCINTPTDQVALIYQNIEVGTPIVCYSSGIDYGYAQRTVDGSTVQSESGSSENSGQNGTSGNGDIVIIDGTDGSGSTGSGTENSAGSNVTQGITDEGVPYTGEDQQGVIIIQ